MPPKSHPRQLGSDHNFPVIGLVVWNPSNARNSSQRLATSRQWRDPSVSLPQNGILWSMAPRSWSFDELPLISSTLSHSSFSHALCRYSLPVSLVDARMASKPPHGSQRGSVMLEIYSRNSTQEYVRDYYIYSDLLICKHHCVQEITAVYIYSFTVILLN